MMTVFYEYVDYDSTKVYYRRDRIAQSCDASRGMPTRGKFVGLGFGYIMLGSNRVWLLRDDAVTFIKNRETGTLTAIDEKEFFLIQIQAIPID